MDIIKQSELYKKQIQRLSTEIIRLILEDRSKALEYARIGIGQIEPNNLTEEHIEDVANELQRVAGFILEDRTKKL